MCRKHYIDFFDYRFNKAACSCIVKKKPPILIENKRQNLYDYMRFASFAGKLVCTVVLKYLVVRDGSFEALRIPAKVSDKAGKRFSYFSLLTETSNPLQGRMRKVKNSPL